jgi:hypothetical protein
VIVVQNVQSFAASSVPWPLTARHSDPPDVFAVRYRYEYEL